MAQHPPYLWQPFTDISTLSTQIQSQNLSQDRPQGNNYHLINDNPWSEMYVLSNQKGHEFSSTKLVLENFSLYFP